MPCSVIIPQRRPQNKTRGFVRASAPVLEECDTDEATFMDFPEGFERSISKQGWLNIVNLVVVIDVEAGITALALASGIIVQVIAFIVQVSLEAGRRLYSTSEEELTAAAEITAKAKQGGFGAQLQHLMGGK